MGFKSKLIGHKLSNYLKKYILTLFYKNITDVKSMVTNEC